MNERLVWQKLTRLGHPYVQPLIAFFETEASYCFIVKNIESDACALSVVMKSAPLPDEVIRLMSAQLSVVFGLGLNGINSHK